MLHLAVMKRNQSFIKRLLLSGADINCVDMVTGDVTVDVFGFWS